VTEPAIAFDAPLKLVSMANARMNWGQRHRIVSSQREATHWHMTAALVKAGYRPGNKIADCLAPDGSRFIPSAVSLKRFGPGTLDGDNLQNACKAPRDTIAHLLRIDDGDPRVQWVYAQERRTAWGCRIELWK
jgi:hypothetical protein